MKTGIVIQARMTSTRLPGKILKRILDRPLLSYQLERLRRIASSDAICIATTRLPSDDAVAEFCREEKVACFRGSEHDVLSRYYGAAVQENLDFVVRVTSDCPLIDPEITDAIIRTFHSRAGILDYFSNTLQRSFPRGLDTEVFPFRILEKAHQTATDPAEREHVTLHVYKHPKLYRLGNYSLSDWMGVSEPMDESHHRWTVDTIDDYRLICLLIEELYPRNPEFSFTDVLDALKQHPDWVNINQKIQQKLV